jgi:hypothetical protein
MGTWLGQRLSVPMCTDRALRLRPCLGAGLGRWELDAGRSEAGAREDHRVRLSPPSVRLAVVCVCTGRS